MKDPVLKHKGDKRLRKQPVLTSDLHKSIHDFTPSLTTEHPAKSPLTKRKYRYIASPAQELAVS